MLVNRMIRAARLEPGLYEEVEHDLTATTQALLVVILVSLAGGFGGAVGKIVAGHPGAAVSGLVGGIVSAIVAWIVWSVVIYFLGTAVLGGTATPGEVMRTLGFAYSPTILAFFGFIPCVGGLIALIGVVWSWVAGIIAVRQALDFETSKAVLTVIIAALVMLFVMALLAVFGFGLSLLGSMFGAS